MTLSNTFTFTIGQLSWLYIQLYWSICLSIQTRRTILVLRFIDITIGRPDTTDTEFEGPWHPIRGADAHRPDLLSEKLVLRLDHHPIVRSHKVAPVDQDRLPLAWSFCKQPMLVDIRVDDGLALKVDEIFPPIGLDSQGQICIRINIPEAFPPDGRGPITRSPCTESGTPDVRLLLGKVD